MEPVLSPAQKVAAAMPGTVADISARTGYPVPEVYRQIGNLRRFGTRVNAVMGARILDALPGEPLHEPTIFTLDVRSGKE